MCVGVRRAKGLKLVTRPGEGRALRLEEEVEEAKSVTFSLRFFSSSIMKVRARRVAPVVAGQKGVELNNPDATTLGVNTGEKIKHNSTQSRRADEGINAGKKEDKGKRRG